MKRLWTLGALLGGVLMLAGCSGSAEEPEEAAPKGTVPSVQGKPPVPGGAASGAPGSATDGDGK
ncbi:hypothetical protein EON79_22520 [bacterium]|nr:MAG: hypothetical protein EON79_22520 [bacterium]